MLLIPLIVVGVIIWIYWNPSPRLQEKWKKKQAKWDRKISKMQQERGMSDVWDKNEQNKKQ